MREVIGLLELLALLLYLLMVLDLIISQSFFEFIDKSFKKYQVLIILFLAQLFFIILIVNGTNQVSFYYIVLPIF